MILRYLLCLLLLAVSACNPLRHVFKPTVEQDS